MESIEVKYSKKDVSEWAIRKAIYWGNINGVCKLVNDEEYWYIKLEEINECEFSEILNDYILRENLEKNTLSNRQVIINKVLNRIANTIDENYTN